MRVLHFLLIYLAITELGRAQNGLVAAFPCNEGAGATITDITATHHVGTFNNATWTAAGKYGAAFTCNGSNAWVTIPHHPQFDLTTGATLMAWVYPTALSGYRTVIMKETSNGACYYLYSGPGDLVMGGGGFGGSYRETSGGNALPLNTWTHLATTFDGTTIRVYRNAVLVSTLASAGSFDTSANPLRLGGNLTWGEWWAGSIDEVRVYNRALSATEIATDRDTPLVAGPTAPVMATVTPPQGSTVRSLTQLDITFSETVIGVDAADLQIGGLAATSVTPLGNNTYRFTFSAAPTGPVGVNFISSHGIVDLESPPVAFAGAAWNYTVDPNAPLDPVRLNEVVAVGAPGGLADADGDFEDWVELLNTGTTTVNLTGWSLSDDASEPGKWVFPVRSIPAGGFLTVFLSEKNRSPASGELHANFKLKLTGGSLRLYNADAPRQVISSFAPLPGSQAGLSYGLNAAGQLRFFGAPTPNAANAGTEYTGIAEAPVPSVPAGYFSSAFSLALTTTTPGASIRYTTNGTPPTTASTLYVTPLNISATTVVRATAFASGMAPSEVTTRTYLFLADVLTQSSTGATPAGWPATWGANRVDYGMDPDVIGAGAPYQSQALAAMQAVPALSIVMKLPDLFDSTTGIYANPGQNGDNWERPASLELLDPSGAPGFQANGGLRIRGNFSRDTNNAKHSFRMFFRERYGTGKLDFPLFGTDAADKQDVVDLRTSQDFSWAYLASTEATFVTDSFARDLMQNMGQPSTRGDFYHLFINGQYWGLYNTEERVNPSYAANYFGGIEEEYDVIKVDSFNTQVAAGSFDAWTQLWNLTEAGVASDTALQSLLGNNPNGTRNPALPIQIDAVNLCDYMLMNFVLDNRDGPIYIDGNQPNNFFAVRPRDGRAGWKFLAHDSEYSMFSVTGDVTGPPTSVGATISSSNARRMWEKCMANAEFRSIFADRVQRHCFGNGALTAVAQAATWQHRATELDLAVIGESARWGDSARATPLTRNNDWLPRINFFLNNWFPTRTTNVISQLRARGYFPALAAPELAPAAGTVNPGTVVTLTPPVGPGVIYYTLNGVDPRSFGGALNPAALVWSGNLTLLNGVRLRARFKDGVNWSPLVAADYFLAQDFTKLAVSEVMYHAVDSATVAGSEFDFIEFTNTGDKSLDLSGLYFTAGLGGTFPTATTLAPGAYLVAARNPSAMLERYPGVTVVVTFTGKLDNNGETVTLATPGGGEILSLTYNNAPPWPAAADGLGFSLVNLAPATFAAPEEGRRWRASANLYGSPGAADPVVNTPSIRIGEIFTGTSPFVELHNPTAGAVDVSGWWLTDDLLVPGKYVLPMGSLIPANGALAVSAATLGFPLAQAGGSIYLLSASAGVATGYSHAWKYGPTDTLSLGRVTDSSGEEWLVPLTSPTPEAVAASPKLGPVVINEIWYHPPTGFFEMVELYNAGATAVVLDGWRLEGFGYTFPTGTSLAAGGYLLVTTDAPTAFRTRHGIPVGVPILGPVTGTLDDGGERISLERPSTATVGAFVALDFVRYNDKAPWPATADGSGPSLQRLSSGALALEPTNWQGQGLTLGKANASNVAPTVAMAAPLHLSTFTPPGTITLTVNAADTDGQISRVEFYDSSTKLGEDATAPYSFTLANAAAGEHWLRAVAVDDAFASTTSIPVLMAGLGPVPFVVSPWGAIWKYKDDGIAPATTWKSLTFDDSTWKSGPAELGYGENDEATRVEDNSTLGYNAADTNRYITTWFRRTFSLTNAAEVTGLAGRMLRDDGVAIYLNGTEVWRDNLAANASATTPATSSISGATESVQITQNLTTSLLVSGNNILAVELHQAATDSSDVSFNLELTAARPGLAPDPDTDGDGMKDRYELAQGFSYWNPLDAAQDADGDGSTNLTESRLGLNPRNGAQSFRASGTVNSPGHVVLTWPSAPGLKFAIKRSSDLATWQPLGTVDAVGTSATYTDPAPGGPHKFYRIELLP